MQVLRKKLHVRPVPQKEEMINRIIHLQTRKQTKILCDVLQVGATVEITKAGDRIYIEPETGVPMGDDTLIISEHEVRAVFPFVPSIV